MLHFKLEVQNLIFRELNPSINVFETKDPVIIQNTINNFNNEIKWEGMFDLNVANDRFLSGSRMFVATFNDMLYGHCWLDFKNELNHVLYNVYSKSTDTPRKYGGADMLYHVIKNETKGAVEVEIDDWNTKSINMFKKLGFVQI